MKFEKQKLAYEIMKINRLIMRFIDTKLVTSMEKTLTPSQAHAIAFIGTLSKQKDVYQKDIQKEFDLKSSSVSLMLKNMEKNNLINRNYISTDERLKKITLTDKAIKLRHTIIKSIHASEENIINNISEKEIEIFLEILEKIRKNIKHSH